ncbi:nitrate reductase molybdenum cofactor assembly chaperone [Streptomyces phaeofaciens]|uniref:nitrate reductase molybdenum cofactor assembly chaperone n=1 Tax=Streptomyces phaeofaciens TaxID=68254 RepID=UPI0036C51434
MPVQEGVLKPSHRQGRGVAATQPRPVGGPLLRFAERAGRTPLPELAADYVATFDHRKRCCLYLTYYAHGDTRKRGMALLRLKQTYAAAGRRLCDDELPDHLAVVLEFAATEPVAGARLLTEHRAGGSSTCSPHRWAI